MAEEKETSFFIDRADCSVRTSAAPDGRAIVEIKHRPTGLGARAQASNPHEATKAALEGLRLRLYHDTYARAHDKHGDGTPPYTESEWCGLGEPRRDRVMRELQERASGSFNVEIEEIMDRGLLRVRARHKPTGICVLVKAGTNYLEERDLAISRLRECVVLVRRVAEEVSLEECEFATIAAADSPKLVVTATHRPTGESVVCSRGSNREALAAAMSNLKKAVRLKQGRKPTLADDHATYLMLREQASYDHPDAAISHKTWLGMSEKGRLSAIVQMAKAVIAQMADRLDSEPAGWGAW